MGYNRILQVSKDHKQITLPDSRYYRRNGNFYPSITYILQCYPKGKHFEDWLKQVGYSADTIVRRAGDEGTKVHNLIELYLTGVKINLLDSKGNLNYEPNIWSMFLKFVEWWETWNPTLIESEIFLFSDEYKFAGTTDLVCEINGERWIIDFKTSNHLHKTYDLQLSAYAKAYEECFNVPIHRTGILWLKSSKRKLSDKKMQGKGWEIYESDRTIDENFNIFKLVRQIFDIEFPNPDPIITNMITEVKMKNNE